MPLTPFQKEIAEVIARNRKPESHFAGGSALNRDDSSPRFSRDFDLFHDRPEHLTPSAEADFRALVEAAYSVEWDRRPETGHGRALVRKGDESLKLEWVNDSPFRFFPAQPDPVFGYCLHRADLATNKILALASREEIRDYIDILYLHDGYLSLGAIVWAACGKDQGYTPDSLLSMAKRHVRYREEELQSEALAQPLTLRQLKEQWDVAATQAEELFLLLPEEDIGCLYLDPGGNPVTPTAERLGELRRHFGSVGGSWPK
jgi:hypothetical protein